MSQPTINHNLLDLSISGVNLRHTTLRAELGTTPTLLVFCAPFWVHLLPRND